MKTLWGDHFIKPKRSLLNCIETVLHSLLFSSVNYFFILNWVVFCVFFDSFTPQIIIPMPQRSVHMSHRSVTSPHWWNRNTLLFLSLHSTLFSFFLSCFLYICDCFTGSFTAPHQTLLIKALTHTLSSLHFHLTASQTLVNFFQQWITFLLPFPTHQHHHHHHPHQTC